MVLELLTTMGYRSFPSFAVLLMLATCVACIQVSTADASCTLPPQPMSNCLHLKNVCVDQQSFISYDPAYQPDSSVNPLPMFNVTHLHYNWPNNKGNGEKYKRGSWLKFGEVNIRAATSMEHCKDMQQPSFDTCNVPFVVYAPWPYNALETFTRLYMNLLNGKMRETMSPKLTPVVGTPRGLKMATFTRVYLRSIFEQEPTTLAELSNRGAACEAGSATIEQDMSVNEFGLRPTPKNRCFQNLYLCKLRQEGHATGVIKAATHLVNFYKTHLLLKKEKLASAGHWAWQGVDANTMRVVIATREGHGSRLIVNREDLVTECQKWVPKHLDGGTAQPTEGSVPSQSKGVRMKQWSQAKCVIYNFGDPIADMALMQETDVLVSLHGSSCMNAFYMPEGSTLVEVRAYGFDNKWADQRLFHHQLDMEKKIHWHGVNILDKNLSHPALAEQSDSEVYSRFSSILSKDRSVTMPWRAMKHQLDLIADIGGSRERLEDLGIKPNVRYVSDKLEPEWNPMNGVQKPGKLQGRERGGRRGEGSRD